jgi:hypothetical protein
LGRFGLAFDIDGYFDGLIFKQPDLGTAILVMGIFVVMLYASGMLIVCSLVSWGFGDADAISLACFKTLSKRPAVGLS